MARKAMAATPAFRQPSRAHWPCVPIIAGNWIDLDAEQVDAMRGRLPIRVADIGFAFFVTQMRELEILCLPGWSVLEIAAGSVAGHRAVIRALVSDHVLLPLDGTGTPFRIACARDFAAEALQDHAAMRQYLRLFTSLVRSQGRRFRVIEHSDEAASTAGTVRPIELRQSSGERLCCTAMIEFDHDLFTADFTIAANGDIAMTDDHYVMAMPRRLPEVFDGPWQIFGIN